MWLGSRRRLPFCTGRWCGSARFSGSDGEKSPACSGHPFDFDGGTLSVLAQLDRKGQLSQPKSAAGVRRMAVPEALLDLLKVQKSAADPDQDGRGLVFTSADGGPLDYSNWRHRVWLPAISSAS